MAFTIPETIASRPGSATPGERKVFVALRDHLPEDYLVYYDISVGGRYPDFIVVGPDLGLVVLEVKDWRLDSIVEMTGEGAVLRGIEEAAPNPVQQARAYCLKTVDLLKTRAVLADGRNLRCAWGYGAIFPNLKKKEVETPSLYGPSLEQALGPGLVLTGDDLKPDSILSSLRRLIPDWATARREPLNPPQVDEIRGVLFPEIRVGWGHTDDEILRVMDRAQERLAKTLGEGHRLLRGVAGSGKTVALICRAGHLRERYPEWRILVLCYNLVLANFLRDAIGADERLEILHFHRWCRRELDRAGIRIPAPPRPSGSSDYWTRDIPRLLLHAHADGSLATGSYQAILIDEGQDFADDWYRAVLRALDPDTGSLFIAVDSSQTIYRRKLSWREIGIQIKGRTRVLRVNYRNTGSILSTAYGIIRDLDAPGRAPREEEDEYVVPDKALRNGPAPEVRRYASAEAGRRLALEWIRERLARSVPPREILILVPSGAEQGRLERWLEDAGVPVRLVRRPADLGAVRLSTIHSAKGLDAEHVLLLGAQGLDRWNEAEARRLLYIAMTRARTELCVTYQGKSALMSRLEELVSRVK